MENNKKHSIRKRINSTVLLITAISLIITSVFGVISMFAIQRQSESALTDQVRYNLSVLMKEKSSAASVRFDKYKEIVTYFTDYIHELLCNPDDYKRLDVKMPQDIPAGTLSFQPGKMVDDVSYEENWDFIQLMANTAPRFEPIIRANIDATQATFWGFTNNVIFSYDNIPEYKDGSPYDMRQSGWWKLAEENRAPSFTDVYLDSFGKGLTITCSDPIYDKNDEFCGVLGMDILIGDLYSSIIDIDLGEGAFAFIVDGNGNVISPDADKETTRHLVGFNGLDDGSVQKIISEDSGILSCGDAYYAYSTIDSVGWKLCTYMPTVLVLEPVENIGQNIVSSIIVFSAFFLFIVIAVFIIIYMLSGTITKPIIDLKNDVGEISSGNLDHRAAINDNDEIGDLALRFNEMAESLKDHIDTVTKITEDRERVNAELNIAAKMQTDMLPKNFPHRDDLEIYATMTPAKEMGGDFYDFFFIDNDHLALIMADVSGKGIPAAMFMIIAKTLMKIRTTAPGKPSQMLCDINNTLCADNPTGLFVTAWFGILTLSSGELTYTNAGHEYPVIMHQDGDYKLLENDNMPPLATVEEIEYFDETVKLQNGDRLFLYTDGVPEAKNPEGERFGTGKMLEILNRSKDLIPEELLKKIKQEVDSFTGESDPFDDITMMNVVWKGHD